jgi:anaerobic selenocysteine-containing dehydrogenase
MDVQPVSGVNNLRVAHAVCSLDCPDSCGVLVTVQTGVDGSERAVKLQGDPAHPVTQGFLCGKVARYLDRVYAPDRLLYPMRRRPGVAKGMLAAGKESQAFERIGWDEALGLIATRLTQIAAEFGPESVLPYSYAGTIGQLGFGSMDRRFFYRLGASQLDRTICSSAGGEALMRVYGVKVGTAPQDFAEAGMVIAWGANIHGNNIHLWPFIEQARRRGAKLVVIDPYRTRTAGLAEDHLAVNPGSDVLLALAMMHVIFRDGLEDRDYLETCTNGAEDLRAHALRPEHTPERAAAITGIAADGIERLATEYATCLRRTGRPPVIRLNYGIQRSENGGTAARAVCMLPLIVGAWKQRGGGLQLSTSGAFPFDSQRLQMPDLMQRSELGRAARVVNMSRLGHALTGLEDPPVKALFVYNSNPASVAPNQTAVLRGMARQDLFTVVHDQFFTDTADYADLVLPAPTFLETKDVQGAYGHLVAQLSEQAMVPLGEVRSNVDVFAALGQRMFPDEECFRDSVDDLIEQALGEHSPRDRGWFAGITRERLEQEKQIPLTLPVDAEGATLPFSTPEWFRTGSGKGELLPVPVYVAPLESRGQSGLYPLEFLGRKASSYMNTTFANQAAHQKMEARSAGMVEMHAEDAAARAIADGDAVEIFNDRGRIVLNVRISTNVGRGVVSARLDWTKYSGALGAEANVAKSNVNALTSERLTDFGGGATFYSCLVEIRRLDNPDSAGGCLLADEPHHL